MRGTVSKYRIQLKPKTRRRLEAVVRRRTKSHWLVIRSKVILLSSAGKGIAEIGAALSLDRQVVRRWLKRFLLNGFDGLKDRKRTGRPRVIERCVLQKVATLIVQSPSKFGLPHTRWSVRDLSLFVSERYAWQISRSSLSRFLRSIALKPHRVKYWLNPTDPDFDEKAAAICALYVSPPPDTIVLCIDEKPGVQALSRRYPTLPARRGRVARVEFEYKRHGTRNIFAAFNVRTGHVIVEVTADRSTPSVFAFLDQVLRHYRRGRIIMVTDNIHTRRGEPAKAWLQRHPRVTFAFTPFHGSWLNQVEIWFGILTRKALRGRSFGSLDDLDFIIYAFADYWNQREARPFEWTYEGTPLAA
jgi:transposase